MLFDKDLQSIQEVRSLLASAREAQTQFSHFSQDEVDLICRSMAEAGFKAVDKLAEMAVAETGFGIVADKRLKNIVATDLVYRFIKPMKTVGVVRRDLQKRVYEIAEPMGIVAGIIPSTNPTSTTLYKILIALKARNGIVLSPHPAALQCTLSAAKIMNDAALAAGAPAGIIGCMSSPTREGTHELMVHPGTSVILATGGTAMVRAAYSSGKPAFGVGPGNVPVFIERTAEIRKAVADIITSKTFDNGTVCASEQAIVTDEPIHNRVVDELENAGAFFLSQDQEKILGELLVTAQGTINPKCVGQSACFLAEKCGFPVPEGTKVLVAQPGGVGPQYPLSREKLSPVLALYREKDWKAACDLCIEIIRFGGIGHTMGIHSRDDEIIMEFALQKPVFRIIANSPTTHGAVGYTTGLPPALTLGCGTWGGSSTSDNVSPLHLINWKRLAYGIHDIHSEQQISQSEQPKSSSAPESTPDSALNQPLSGAAAPLSELEIQEIISKFLTQSNRKPT